VDLARFGFTPTEAKVYLALLPISPATGYAVAQAAKLARANTYDALEGLAGRGAVTRLPGRPLRYAALDSDALVLRLRREYSSDLDSLADVLSRVRQAQAKPGLAPVQTIADAASLFARAIDCARSARSELLAVVGPWALDTFADLEAVRGRLNARVLSLGTPAPADAVVRQVPTREIEAYWGGLPIALVADGRRAVCGVVRGAGDAAGIATEHPGVIPFVRHLLRRELASASS
jgi:sugar-specific transcriptional regulator TrmB